MPISFTAFRNNKESIKNERKEEYSERTLKYFNMITEMLEREADYGSSFPFLESVYHYIEQNEFISDNQCSIVDKISEHPECGYYGYEAEPF